MWKFHADVLDYHRALVANSRRTDAFRSALGKVVREGAVVADVGAGTGLLSILACQAGARRVYAMDHGHIAAVASVLITDNGLSDRVSLIRASSLSVQLPERVDVVVSETLWNAGIGEGIVLTMRDACRRFLKPGGHVIPRGFDILAAPLEAPDQFLAISGWRTRTEADFGSLERMAANNVYRAWLDPGGALAPPGTVVHVNLNADAPETVGGTLDCIVQRRGVCHGFGVWFSARLGDDIVLDNAPGLSDRSWKQAFFPLDASPEVEPGDVLRLGLRCTDNEMRFDWSVELSRPACPTSKQWRYSTLAGFAKPLVA